MLYLMIQDYYGEISQFLLDRQFLYKRFLDAYWIGCDHDHNIIIDPVIPMPADDRTKCELIAEKNDQWIIKFSQTPDPSTKYNLQSIKPRGAYPIENGCILETQNFIIKFTDTAPDASIPKYPASAILQELQKNQETNTTSAINHISHPNQMGYGPIPQYYPNQTGFGVALAPNGSPPFFVKKK